MSLKPVLPVPTIQDDLAADVRVETERRLRSLQKDLEKAETTKKERGLAVRYHKVKFFGKSVSDPATDSYLSSETTDIERQKLLRKINQVKKQTPVDEAQLFALRVDLNYILVGRIAFVRQGRERSRSSQHYPKLRKYVALFPPKADGESTGENAGPTETDAAREEVRVLIRGQMERGEISRTPEEELVERARG